MDFNVVIIGCMGTLIVPINVACLIMFVRNVISHISQIEMLVIIARFVSV